MKLLTDIYFFIPKSVNVVLLFLKILSSSNLEYFKGLIDLLFSSLLFISKLLLLLLKAYLQLRRSVVLLQYYSVLFNNLDEDKFVIWLFELLKLISWLASSVFNISILKLFMLVLFSHV